MNPEKYTSWNTARVNKIEIIRLLLTQSKQQKRLCLCKKVEEDGGLLMCHFLIISLKHRNNKRDRLNTCGANKKHSSLTTSCYLCNSSRQTIGCCSHLLLLSTASLWATNTVYGLKHPGESQYYYWKPHYLLLIAKSCWAHWQIQTKASSSCLSCLSNTQRTASIYYIYSHHLLVPHRRK